MVLNVRRSRQKLSAKLPLGKFAAVPTRAPSDLPPELWIAIMRYASSPPFPPMHPFAQSPLDPFLFCSSLTPSSDAISFLTLPHSHSHLRYRLAYYRAIMRQKAFFTLVCRAWHDYAQEVLYEFIWISKASQAKALASSLQQQQQLEQTLGENKGKYIRRLHIETPALEKCCPTDLRTILDYAPRLTVYSDHRSVRRNLYEESCNPRTSPEQLLSALARPGNSLKRLSWTNYDRDGDRAVPYIQTLTMTPGLDTIVHNLEFLELTFCSTHLRFVASSSSFAQFDDACNAPLTLPALRSLKVTLDNATFQILSTWEMPALRNLSVLSADFSYASSGFSQFFIVHGPKLHQLELGHSSSMIEEHYLTTPSHPHAFARAIPLASWCPNLVQFICSADAEWNWQHPDWIAPHVLLPSHPTLKFIGIRDIDKRLLDDWSLAASSPSSSFHTGSVTGSVVALDQEDDAGTGVHEQPFFMLMEQISSLLQRDAFPALMYIRDMSWDSDRLRRGFSTDVDIGESLDAWEELMTAAGANGMSRVAAPRTTKRPGSAGSVQSSCSRARSAGIAALGRGGIFALSTWWKTHLLHANQTQTHCGNGSALSGALNNDHYRDGRSYEEYVAARRNAVRAKQIIRFWRCVLDRCRLAGVWLEDFKGVNVTSSDLKRAEAYVDLV